MHVTQSQCARLESSVLVTSFQSQLHDVKSVITNNLQNYVSELGDLNQAVIIAAETERLIGASTAAKCCYCVLELSEDVQDP